MTKEQDWLLPVNHLISTTSAFHPHPLRSERNPCDRPEVLRSAGPQPPHASLRSAPGHGLIISVLRMEGGNKSLVQDFVCQKLIKKGFKPHCCSDSSSEVFANGSAPAEQTGARPGGTSSGAAVSEKVLQALLESSEEFELRYRQAFSDLTCQLHITPNTALQSFEQVVDELFRDGINWGRIVAFFSFGGALCVESADKEMEELLPWIIQWMAAYLDSSLEPWIQANGRWEAFVHLYGNDAAAKTRKSQESFGRWLLTGVTVAGLALLATYLIRR